ncbi:acyl-CoA dehydrogenase family protein [Lentzea sp. NPDC042327]|uniref:acyl-CoA dehydrogenase family protein n=1 Tax=Lentzea sp. NPDC042327 TaxID=3154801 RepID=UPI0033CD3E89
MDFTLDDTQQEIVRLAADVLGRESTTPWKALGEAGLLALAVPQRLGGHGLGVLETALLLTEVGRSAADVPAFATLALGVLPIARHGTPHQQDELLPLVTEQHAVFTAALSEPSTPLPATPSTRANPDGTGLTGLKVHVPRAAEAGRILVSALLGDRPGTLVVDPAQPGVSTTDSTVRFDNAHGDPLDGDLTKYALAGACAVGDGVLAGALDLTVTHVGTRHQFGAPLSTFQAVAGQVADVHIAARTLHLATLAACWSLDDADLAIAAHWLAAEALPAVHTCHHLHGGLGLDITYPMHRYYGLAKELTRFVGGAEHRLGQIDVH